MLQVTRRALRSRPDGAPRTRGIDFCSVRSPAGQLTPPIWTPPSTRFGLIEATRQLFLDGSLHEFGREGDRCCDSGWTRSDALENLCASYSAAPERSVSPCHDCSRTDKASRPGSGHVAIRCPVPRRLEDHPRATNASNQIIRNSRTGASWTGDENSAEISSRINRQYLQHGAPLSLPN